MYMFLSLNNVYHTLRVLSTLVAREWKAPTMLTSQFLIWHLALEYNDRTRARLLLKNYLWMLLDYLEKCIKNSNLTYGC